MVPRKSQTFEPVTMGHIRSHTMARRTTHCHSPEAFRSWQCLIG
jgi:hypothetical protein